MKKLFIAFVAVALLIPVGAFAQGKPNQAPAAAREEAQKKPADYERRLELSKKMHEVQPASMQVIRAIEQVSMQLPPQDRDGFVNAMKKSIDGDKLESVSVGTMAEMFTVTELERMLDYFSSAEARSISEKMPLYNARMQPEIMKMLDAAMMAARTGSAAQKQK